MTIRSLEKKRRRGTSGFGFRRGFLSALATIGDGIGVRRFSPVQYVQTSGMVSDWLDLASDMEEAAKATVKADDRARE